MTNNRRVWDQLLVLALDYRRHLKLIVCAILGSVTLGASESAFPVRIEGFTVDPTQSHVPETPMAYSNDQITVNSTVEHRMFYNGHHFATIVDSGGTFALRPRPGVDRNGFGSTLYLQAFVAGATLRGASIDSIASTSSGILVNASGAVSLGVASTYGTWQLTGLLFTYDPTQKVVEASGQYSISLPGQISGAGGDLNLYRLASNFLDDVPHLNGDLGDTGDMSQADYTTDHGVFTWVPTDGNTFPGQMTDLLSIKVVGDFYDLDAPAQGIGSCPIQAAYKPTLRIDLTANVSGYHMIPGFIYDEAKSKLFFEDNVGITPVILASSSTETEFMYSVDIITPPI